MRIAIDLASVRTTGTRIYSDGFLPALGRIGGDDDFKDFEFGENQYDFIVAGFSLHHCNSEEKKELFKKIYTALKPNGVFSCSDLMIDKKSTEHGVLLEQWKGFVLNNYPTQEKWDWLMEHYSEFDKPDSFHNQKKWLEQVGFSNFNTLINESYWVHYQAIKS